MRKLKRKTTSKTIPEIPKLKKINLKSTSLPVKQERKLKKYYKKQRCAFVFSNGTQCKKLAVGKSSLCKRHGGDPTIKENLYKGTEEVLLPNVRVKFDPAFHPIRYIELSKDGLSEVEIAAEFEIAVITIQEWAEKFESFYIAKEVGKAMHESWWLRQGKENMSTRAFNASLYKYITMNKLGYSDKIEQKSLNMNIHGVLMVPDSVSEEDWEKGAIDG